MEPPSTLRPTPADPDAPIPGVPEVVRDEAPAACAGEHPWFGSEAPTPRPLRPGDRLGRYVLQQPLGQGGMGVVYGAVNPELGRRVAIKLVRSSRRGGHERLVTRLRREAIALARLCHPNIVAIHDIGTTSRGTFMAMEYVRGQNLRRWLRAAERTPRGSSRCSSRRGADWPRPTPPGSSIATSSRPT